MAVTTNLQLPNQPTDGSTVLHPLGGNGFVSPHSVYHVIVNSAADASGGAHTVQVFLDPRYVQLVATVSIGVEGLSANVDIDAAMIERAGSPAEVLQVRETAVYRPTTGLAFDAIVSWCPEPFLMSAVGSSSSSIRLMTDNTDGVDVSVRCHIFNFDKQARTTVPIETLTRCLVRPGSVVA